MLTDGSTIFRNSAAQAANDEQARRIQWIADRADELERRGLCRVRSHRQQNPALHLNLLDERTNMAVGFNWDGYAQITLYRKVLKRRAPKSLSDLEKISIKQKFDVKNLTDDLFTAIEAAYREAAENPKSKRRSKQ